jgi:tape measure domain-containing protein
MGAGFHALQADVDSSASKLKSIQSGMAGFGLVVGGAGIIGGMMRATVSMDSLERGLTTVSGSAEQTEAQLTRLREVAKSPGLGFREAIQGSVRLQAAGMSAKLAERSLSEFGNALASVGGGKAELDGVTRALSQIMSKGKVSAEEINQIAERVPQIRVVMEKAFGTADTEKLQKMGIDSETFINRVVTAMHELPRATGGVQNSIENLSDSWDRFLFGTGGAGKGGLKGVVYLANSALTGLNNLNDATHGVSGAVILAGVGLVTLAGGVLVVMPGIKALRDLWIEVAVAARSATAAQVQASTAGAGAGTAATAGGAGGMFGRGKGMLGRLGVGIGGAVAGQSMVDWGKENADDKNTLKAFAASEAIVMGRLTQGASAGWSTGGPVGAIIGALGGGVMGLYDEYKTLKENRKAPSAIPSSDPQIARSNDYLKELCQLMGDTKRAIIGGGDRTAIAVNSGDLQRAVARVMSAQVI